MKKKLLFSADFTDRGGIFFFSWTALVIFSDVDVRGRCRLRGFEEVLFGCLCKNL